MKCLREDAVLIYLTDVGSMVSDHGRGRVKTRESNILFIDCAKTCASSALVLHGYLTSQKAFHPNGNTKLLGNIIKDLNLKSSS